MELDDTDALRNPFGRRGEQLEAGRKDDVILHDQGPVAVAVDKLFPTGRVRQETRNFSWPQRLSEDEFLGGVVWGFEAGKLLGAQFAPVYSGDALEGEALRGKLF